MAFLNEEYALQQIDPKFYGSKSVANSQKIHFQKLSKPIQSGSQGRWKTEMTSAEIKQFHAIAGKELLRLGYSL
jgi:hypothetical protein